MRSRAAADGPGAVAEALGLSAQWHGDRSPTRFRASATRSRCPCARAHARVFSHYPFSTSTLRAAASAYRVHDLLTLSVYDDLRPHTRLSVVLVNTCRCARPHCPTRHARRAVPHPPIVVAGFGGEVTSWRGRRRPTPALVGLSLFPRRRRPATSRSPRALTSCPAVMNGRSGRVSATTRRLGSSRVAPC